MSLLDNNDQFYRRGRVFLLGAGFSAAAGIPMMSGLLNQTMHRFGLECPRVYSRLQNYAKIAFLLGEALPNWEEVNFSEFCTFLDYVELRELEGSERWSDEGCRERLALKHYLGKVIAQNTPVSDRVPELYRRFAAQLRPEDAVVTFNWDCLLENALKSVNAPFDYGDTREGVTLLKMHGSVNWRADTRRYLYPPKLRWNPVRFMGVSDSGLLQSEELASFDGWRGAEPIGGEVSPFVVLPGYGKARDIAKIASLWYKPEAVFCSRCDVYIIGLSLSHDDFFVRSFLLDNLSEPLSADRKVTVINPGTAPEDNYAFVLKHPGSQFIREQFSLAHIDQMAAR